MKRVANLCQERTLENVVADPNGIKQVAGDLCDTALTDAKATLHPLLQQVKPQHLDQRCEFLQAFKHAMERRIARQLAIWQPCIRAVFEFDNPRGVGTECWDGTIHLLVMVPQLLNSVKTIGTKLDRDILKRLRRSGWPRFEKTKSIIEIQQVTTDEFRRGISYGAMFLSLYAAPAQVWPSARKQKD